MTFAAFRMYYRFWRVLSVAQAFYCGNVLKRSTRHFQRPGLARALFIFRLPLQWPPLPGKTITYFAKSAFYGFFFPYLYWPSMSAIRFLIRPLAWIALSSRRSASVIPPATASAFSLPAVTVTVIRSTAF